MLLCMALYGASCQSPYSSWKTLSSIQVDLSCSALSAAEPLSFCFLAADTPLADVWTLALTPDAAQRFATASSAAHATAAAIAAAQGNLGSAVSRAASYDVDLPVKKAKGQAQKPKAGEGGYIQQQQQQQQPQQYAQQQQVQQFQQYPQQQQQQQRFDQLQQQQQLQHRQGQQQQQQQQHYQQQQDQDQEETAPPKVATQKRVTAYSLYLDVRQPQLAIQNPGAPKKVLKDQLRNTWKGLLPDEKEVWKRQARRFNEGREVEAAAATAAAARGVGKAAAAAARARGISGLVPNMDPVVEAGGAAAAPAAVVAGGEIGDVAGGRGVRPYQQQELLRCGSADAAGALQQQHQQQTQRAVQWQQQQQLELRQQLEDEEEREFQDDEEGPWEEEEGGQEGPPVSGPGIGQGPMELVHSGQGQRGLQMQMQQQGSIANPHANLHALPPQQQRQFVPCMNGWQDEDQLQHQKHQQPRRKTWPEGHINGLLAAPPRLDRQYSEQPLVQQTAEAWTQQQGMGRLLKQRQQQQRGAPAFREPQLDQCPLPLEQQQTQKFQKPAERLPQPQGQPKSRQQGVQQGHWTQPPVLELPGLQRKQHGGVGARQQVQRNQEPSVQVPVTGEEAQRFFCEQEDQRQHSKSPPVHQQHEQLHGAQQQQQQVQLRSALSVQHPHVQQQPLGQSAPVVGGYAGPAAAPGDEGASMATAVTPACLQMVHDKSIQSSLQQQQQNQQQQSDPTQQQQQQCSATLQQQWKPAVDSAAAARVSGDSPLGRVKLLLSRQQQAVLSASVGRTLQKQALPHLAGPFGAAQAYLREAGNSMLDTTFERVSSMEGSMRLMEGEIGGAKELPSQHQQQKGAATPTAGGKRSAAAAGMETQPGGFKTSNRDAGMGVGVVAAAPFGMQQLGTDGDENKGATQQQLGPGDQGGRRGTTCGLVPDNPVAERSEPPDNSLAVAVQASGREREAMGEAAALRAGTSGEQGTGCMDSASAPVEGWPKGLTVCAPTTDLVGAEVKGVIEGIAGSGYIAKVLVGGTHYQAVLFSPYLTLATGDRKNS